MTRQPNLTATVVNLEGAGVRAAAPKIDAVRAAMRAGHWREAILAAAKFQELGAEKPAILKAREALLRPHFQQQLGRCPQALIAEGKEALVRRYGH
jgi:hypothetical protein